MVALVGSMDGSLGRYCAHMSACPANTEITGSLTRGMTALLKSFASKNSGEIPKRLLVQYTIYLAELYRILSSDEIFTV